MHSPHRDRRGCDKVPPPRTGFAVALQGMPSSRVSSVVSADSRAGSPRARRHGRRAGPRPAARAVNPSSRRPTGSFSGPGRIGRTESVAAPLARADLAAGPVPEPRGPQFARSPGCKHQSGVALRQPGFPIVRRHLGTEASRRVITLKSVLGPPSSVASSGRSPEKWKGSWRRSSR